MAVFSVEGKLGTGKTKFCVWRAQLALREGRRVCSNVDLKLEKLTPEARRSYVRLPDKPSAHDLSAAGHGNPDSYDEDRNGVMILDELGTWLNSRSFQDKERQPMIDWLIHARKHGWDVYLIVQDAGMIDKQVRTALIQFECRCVRLDKVLIPFVGKLLRMIFGGRAGMLPRAHLVTARLGEGTTKVVAERWMYRGDDLHAAYDTRQIFVDDYPHASHSVLVPWDFRPPVSFYARLRAAWEARTKPAKPAPKAKLPQVEALMRLEPGERVRAWRELGLM